MRRQGRLHRQGLAVRARERDRAGVEMQLAAMFQPGQHRGRPAIFSAAQDRRAQFGRSVEHNRAAFR